MREEGWGRGPGSRDYRLFKICDSILEVSKLLNVPGGRIEETFVLSALDTAERSKGNIFLRN